MQGQKLKVLYEDNHVIAVIKPFGVPTECDSSNLSSLYDMTKQYLRTKHNKPGNVYLGIVHRLDKPVKGIVLFAKTSKGASRLCEDMRNHKITKRYRAWVEGILNSDRHTLTHYLQKTQGHVRIINPTGFCRETKSSDKNYPERSEGEGSPSSSGTNAPQLAKLTFHVLKHDRNSSWLDITLITGRKHQIRAQLAAIGHPIVGDTKYGAKQKNNNDSISLIAHHIEFFHPVRRTEKIHLSLDGAETVNS